MEQKTIVAFYEVMDILTICADKCAVRAGAASTLGLDTLAGDLNHIAGELDLARDKVRTASREAANQHFQAVQEGHSNMMTGILAMARHIPAKGPAQ